MTFCTFWSRKHLKTRELSNCSGPKQICITCHIYVYEKLYKSLRCIDEDEESMLDQAFKVKDNSRLGCQIEFNERLDGITVELAPE